MDVDNTEEQKEQSISKQEQIDRKTFVQLFSQWSKYNTKQGRFHGLKQKPGLSLIITRYSENFLKNRKTQKGLLERLRMSMLNILLVKFIIGSLSAKNLWTLIKSEFNIDVGRTRIVEILNSNGYKYRSPKLKIIQHQYLRLNWCERHIIETCFSDLFFSDESTFYLDNPTGARWVKGKENYIHTKKSKKNWDMGCN